MYSRELQNNMSILNVFKQTGQVNDDAKTSSFSEIMSKRSQKVGLKQTDFAHINKTSSREMSVKTHDSNDRDYSKKATTFETKTTEAAPKEVESKVVEKQRVVKENSKPVTNEETAQTDDNDIKKDLMKKLKVTEKELDQLMSLLGVDLGQLQEIASIPSVDLSLFQDICTTVSQLDIETTLNTNENVDQKLLETLTSQLEKLSQVMENNLTETSPADSVKLMDFNKQLESLLPKKDLSVESTFTNQKELETIDKVEVMEISPELLDKIKVLLSKEEKVETKLNTETLTTLSAEKNVSDQSDKTTGADPKNTFESLLSKVEDVKVVNTSEQMNSEGKSNQENTDAENMETIVTVSKEGDLVVTKTNSETNTILDQITMKQPSSVTNGTQNQGASSLRQNVFNQIMDAVKTNIKLDDNGSHMLMKLKPEQLGSVELKISIHKGIVQAEINVENEMVKATVESNLDNLKQSLSQKGYQLNQINVSIDSGKKDQDQQFNFNQNSKSKKVSMLEDVEYITDTLLNVSIYQNDSYETSTINYYA